MILACEPVCIGFEHAAVNAAMLAVFADAFPDDDVVFYADESHIAFVAAEPLLRSRNRIRFAELPVPPRKAEGAERFACELKTVQDMFEIAERSGAAAVLYTCISDETLRAIKMQTGKFPGVTCVVVLHGILASLLHRRFFFPQKNRHTFRTWFLLGNSRQLTYIVLGEAIRRELLARFPDVEPYIASIDLPYDYADEAEHEPFRDGMVRFGSLGVLRKAKGSHLFLQLAREVTSMSTGYRPRFVCVGPVVDKKLRKHLGEAVSVPSPDTPLSKEEFASHAGQLDYAVFLHGAKAYTLTASGVMFDAFSHLKPVIALKNPFFTGYFEKMGNIGYLCDSFADMKRLVLRLLDHPPVAEYAEQRQALLRGRELLRIPVLAAALRKQLPLSPDNDR
jgi:glycosyltransferase involved in cell wall biosynthesis